MLYYLFQSVQVVAVGVEAVAVFREQNGSDQPTDSEQQVGQTEQEQRLQLQTHKNTNAQSDEAVTQSVKDVNVVLNETWSQCWWFFSVKSQKSVSFWNCVWIHMRNKPGLNFISGMKFNTG